MPILRVPKIRRRRPPRRGWSSPTVCRPRATRAARQLLSAFTIRRLDRRRVRRRIAVGFGAPVAPGSMSRRISVRQAERTADVVVTEDLRSGPDLRLTTCCTFPALLLERLDHCRDGCRPGLQRRPEDVRVRGIHIGGVAMVTSTSRLVADVPNRRRMTTHQLAEAIGAAVLARAMSSGSTTTGHAHWYHDPPPRSSGGPPVKRSRSSSAAMYPTAAPGVSTPVAGDRRELAPASAAPAEDLPAHALSRHPKPRSSPFSAIGVVAGSSAVDVDRGADSAPTFFDVVVAGRPGRRHDRRGLGPSAGAWPPPPAPAVAGAAGLLERGRADRTGHCFCPVRRTVTELASPAAASVSYLVALAALHPGG